MDYFYEQLLRPLLFRSDPEFAHEKTVAALKLFSRFRPLCRWISLRNQLRKNDPICAFGLNFPNRVGLAAGMDKNGVIAPAAAAFGFGHVEVGTVTPVGQPGNPKPRLFRYPKNEAVVNRMGFNNYGADQLAAHLAKSFPKEKRWFPLGINIGKSKVTPNESAIEDYLKCFSLVADHADYLTVNISSPNTVGLRKLQDEEFLNSLLSELTKANDQRSKKKKAPRIPILLKIAPDLSFTQVDSIVETVLSNRIDGIIATNTTIQRPPGLEDAEKAGGLSGMPLFQQSLNFVQYIYKSTNGSLPIIGSGGIINEETAAAFIDRGATLVQLYTGWIYRGPFFPRTIARSLQSTQIRPIRFPLSLNR